MPDVRSEYKRISELISSAPFDVSADFEAKLIISYFLDCEPSELPLRYAETLSAEQSAKASEMASRRIGGEPLQYILGQWEFMSLPFFVGSGVFIPGPDTEHLAQAGIDFAKTVRGGARLLDLCAGSGCVGISVAHYCENVTADLVELYPEAFAYLEKNIALSGTPRCKAINADALKYTCDKKYDIVLSNPPYITSEEYASLPADVTAQPKTALTDGGDGLSYYRIITRNALDLLREGGMLAFEIGFKQCEPVSELLAAAGYKHVHSKRDYNGLRRVVIGYR